MILVTMIWTMGLTRQKQQDDDNIVIFGRIFCSSDSSESESYSKETDSVRVPVREVALSLS